MLTETQEVELFGNKEVRWFQAAVRQQTYAALAAGHRRICIIQPTGSGKTISSGLILLCEDIRLLLKIPVGRPIRVLFTSHRHRLLTQAEKTFADEESIQIIPHSIMSALDPSIEFDIVVMDECHHEATLSFQMQLEAISAAPLIGLTATPDRNDGRLCKFSKFIEPLTRQEAVDQGFLAESYINTFCDAPARDQVDLVTDMVELCHLEMGQSMAFMRTKQECAQLALNLKKMGIKSSLLVDISERELNFHLSAFEQREHQIAISCMKLGEGVDVKGCQSAIIGRRGKSRGFLNQLIGRAARNDSDCRIYETINPLASDNLDATAIVGVPKEHNFWFTVRGEWRMQQLI